MDLGNALTPREREREGEQEAIIADSDQKAFVQKVEIYEARDFPFFFSRFLGFFFSFGLFGRINVCLCVESKNARHSVRVSASNPEPTGDVMEEQFGHCVGGGEILWFGVHRGERK